MASARSGVGGGGGGGSCSGDDSDMVVVSVLDVAAGVIGVVGVADVDVVRGRGKERGSAFHVLSSKGRTRGPTSFSK